VKKVVVNGTFDILHTGHIKLLNYAKEQGDYLLVCIDTDSRVRKLKGDDRPVHTQEERKLLLENLRAVNEVQLFETDDDLRNIFKEYEPDVMVKGSDYAGTEYLGHEHCKSVKWFNLIDEYSTTKTIQRITAR
jgi:D-beta-D-heptose 7-phosphate kinase/D-beta-D-heptose 1-phosphate adenosyltransferase